MTSAKIEKHCGTLIKFRLETFRVLFEDLTDNQRMELIKSLIWTSPSMYKLHQRVVDEVCCGSFKNTLD